MKAAPYNPDTLKRIRAGATARELGWDDAMFISICRKHEIPVIVAKPLDASVKRSPPPPSPPAPPAPPSKYERRVEILREAQSEGLHLIGPIYFDKQRGRVERDGVVVELRDTLNAMFTMLAAAPDGELVSGPMLCQWARVAPAGAGTLARHLRLALAPINLGLFAKAGKHGGGYALVELSSKKRVAVYPISKKPKVSP